MIERWLINFVFLSAFRPRHVRVNPSLMGQSHAVAIIDSEHISLLLM